MRLNCVMGALVLLVGMAGAQQPNSSNHSLTINGIDGPPFPVMTNFVRTSTLATFTFGTLASQPYALFQGNIHAGQAAFAGGIVDLALSPFPVQIINGFTDPQFHTDFSGFAGFAVNVPNSGSPPNGVPLGLQLALQSVVGDPFNSGYGYSLTAATRITVTQGPVIQYYSLGDESEQQVTLSGWSVPFYGTSRTTLYIGSNGYISLGSTAGSDYTPVVATMLGGPPRIAAQWCDLDCPPNSVRTTTDTNPGNGNPAYMRVDYINVPDWLIPINHNLGIVMRADGYLEIISEATNNASSFDQMVGICAGGNLGGASQSQKNFIGPQPPGSNVGPGILSTAPFAYVGGVNEAFFEWFGVLTQNQNYGNGYNNPYDLPAVTLHFSPSGSGSGPASTDRYVLY